MKFEASCREGGDAAGVTASTYRPYAPCLMRRSIDDAASPAQGDDPAMSWAVALADDYDDAEPRVVVTVEEVGAPGAGLVAHLDPDLARRLRGALRDALAEMGEPPGR